MSTTIIPTRLSSIPDELKARKQWVNWLRVQRRDYTGRLIYTKRPVSPDRDPASTTDPSTWSTFEAAVEAGMPIGYVFSPDDPYTGIDLDHARNPETGLVEAWAWDIVREMASYTELSVSKTGLHIIVEATLGKGRRKDQIELYDRARFFTMTSWHVQGTPTTIEPRQAEVDALVERLWPRQEERQADGPGQLLTSLSDDELRLKLITGRHWVAVGDLFLAGDAGRYGGNLSRALCALATIIAKETKSVDQIDRLMRQSALYEVSEAKRVKWDSPRGDSTWGRGLIEQALVWAAEDRR
jgi:putative DNA primase/helicase